MPGARLTVAVEERLVSYVDEGPCGGVPLVLLHGGGFDHAELSWRLTIRELSPRVRMVVPDLPGYGASAGFGGPHDLTRLGRWLVSFLEALRIERADVAGVSMGGGMALWLALEAPHLVRRLIPVGAYGLMARAPMHRLAHLALGAGLAPLVYGAAGLSPTLARIGLGHTAFGRMARVTPEVVDELMAVARDQVGRRSFEDFLAAEMTASGLRSDLSGRLGEIARPTLLVHGALDRVVPVRHARRAAARIPGAGYLELPTGHWPMRERPDLFHCELARFLDARPEGGVAPGTGAKSSRR